MAIELSPVTSGYSTGVISRNFEELENYLNNNLLHREGLSPGQGNQMEVPLDMNSNPLLNVSTDVSNPGSVLTVGEADSRYVNLTGDSMQGSLNMESYPLFVRIAVNGQEAVQKNQLDAEESSRQAGDANLQRQLSDTQPLEASAFSPVSWHKQIIENSLTVPPNFNAWSFGPEVNIAVGQAVTISEGSFWTIANGVSNP